MKVPSEAELIEIENRAIRHFDSLSRLLARNQPYSYPAHLDPESRQRLQEDVRTLITLARDPSQLLRDIPENGAWDRVIENLPRTAKPEPVPSLAPKQKKRGSR